MPENNDDLENFNNEPENNNENSIIDNEETVEGNNDFASLAETLRRRISRMQDPNETDESFASRPDLLVIDGGKGQLSSVKEIMEEMKCDVEVISLAKREEEVFVPYNSDPYVLPRNSYALRLLQRIRDEAHRFAITFHRDLRKKRQTHSQIRDIPGVGEKRLRILFNTFKTVENIKNASLDELKKLDGIDRKTAENVYNTLHGLTLK